LQFYRESSSPVNVQFPAIVEEVLSLYRRKLTMKNITLRREIGECRPILALPGELRQVISNIFSNAIDATPRGGRIRVRLKEARRWSGNRQPGVLLMVGDNGCGIPRQSFRRIGEVFFTTKGQDGTGLGMWVIRGILRKYSGKLQVCSSTLEHRHGTVMSVFIPYLPVSEISAQEASVQEQNHPSQSRRSE
jgi:signal transduction histidine kinase